MHSDAQSLLLTMSQFSFVRKLLLTQKGLVSSYRDGIWMLLKPHRDIECVKTAISGVRSRVDEFHSQVYQEVLVLCESVDVMESAPRRAGRQQYRSNAPSGSISDNYKRNITIPFVDHLSNELDTRFDANCSQNLVEFMKLLPFEVVKATTQLKPETFSNILQLYGADLPCIKTFDLEPDLWKSKWMGDPQLAEQLNTPEKVRLRLLSKHSHFDYDHRHTTCHKLLV